MAVKEPYEVTVVTTSFIVDEIIEETYGYLSSTCFNYFIVRKISTIEKSLDIAFNKIQYQAFENGADGVISVRTSLETQSQYWFFTRVNVFMEGTMVTFKSTD